MDGEKFAEVAENQLGHCRALLVTKGAEYATEDQFHNFRVAAALQNVNMRQALGGMLAKHVVSIFDMCIADEPASLEKWEEKITDHINYLLLLKGIVVEELDPENFEKR